MDEGVSKPPGAPNSFPVEPASRSTVHPKGVQTKFDSPPFTEGIRKDPSHSIATVRAPSQARTYVYTVFFRSAERCARLARSLGPAGPTRGTAPSATGEAQGREENLGEHAASASAFPGSLGIRNVAPAKRPFLKGVRTMPATYSRLHLG